MWATIRRQLNTQSPITKLSSHGWVLADQTNIFWRGAGPVDGHRNLTSAYRAELGGFVAILHILISICTFHQTTGGSVTIYGDCLSAIKKLQRKSYGGLNEYLVANFDLLNEGRHLFNKLKTMTSVTLSWVKGHYSGTEKSKPHILNDMVHDLANEFLKQDNSDYNPSQTVLEPPSSEISILYDNSTITSNLNNTLRNELYKKRLQETICKAEKWSVQTFERVNWPSYGRAFKNISRCRQNSISKLSHKLFNTNYQNNQYYGHEGKCPCCDEQIETFQHMLSCPSNLSTPHHQNQLEQLQTRLLKAGAPDAIASAIIHGISQWSLCQSGSITQQRSPYIGSLKPIEIAITQAYADQTSPIGWDNLLRGRLSNLWDRAYAMAQTTPNTTLGSSGLTDKIIPILWDYSQAIWEYRNGTVHGKTAEEQAALEVTAVQTEITLAYEEYAKDPFIIPSQSCHLFTSRPLTQRIQLDIDSMLCWLRSYREAKLYQQAATKHQAEAAKHFFKPKVQQQKPKQKENKEETDPEISSHTLNSSSTLSPIILRNTNPNPPIPARPPCIETKSQRTSRSKSKSKTSRRS
jgi:hypothetical protein